jgi:hypothetical protein
MNTSEQVSKWIADEYYGEGAAIGDGTFLKMLMEFFAKFLGSCPLGAQRAHRLRNGNVRQQERARARLEYAAYDWTNGDEEQTKKIVDAGWNAGGKATEQQYVEFATA